MATPRLAYITFLDAGGGNAPDQGLPGGPVYPGQGLPVYPDQGLPPGRPQRPNNDLPGYPGFPAQLPVFPFDPTDPGFGNRPPGRPDQGLPPSPGHPDHGLPGGGGGSTLPVIRPGAKFIVKFLACYGFILVPDNSLPGSGGRPDNELPETPEPK